MNSPIRKIISAVLMVGLLLGLSKPWGKVPALIPLLSPFGGLWQRPLTSELRSQTYRVNGIKGDIEIFWDEYEVPHVFAESVEDLAFAQGFIHASQRLFQMDVQTRSGGARLSEMFGAQTVEMDEFFVRIGLRRVVQKIMETIEEDENALRDLEAYTRGVNAWIDQLTPDRLPSEYRILGVRPERWEMRRYAELAAAMTFNLSGRSFDLILTQYKRKFGVEAIQSLFPEFMSKDFEAPFSDSEIGTKLKRMKVPEGLALSDRIQNLPKYLIQPVESNGSNNWAVGPERSRTGHSILANDTHLGFTLPNIWFEIQLSGPNIDVYGAGFPGEVWVLSGFTPQVGWAVTNGTTDVIDWFEAEVEQVQEKQLKARIGENWTSLLLEEQTIRVRGGSPQVIPMWWSEAGPLFYQEGSHGLFMQWTAHRGSPVLSVFRALNFAKEKSDCLRAIEIFKAPVQNFICADSNSAEIVHSGDVPVRWSGQGQFVHDGNDLNSLRGEYVLFADLPRSTTASNGFVFSANQRPVGKDYPVSLGMDAENSYRARQIQRELSLKSDWGGEDFLKMQLDDNNPIAESVLAIMLEGLDGAENQSIQELLRQWNFQDNESLVAPTLFFYWWNSLKVLVWKDQLGEGKESRWPRDERLHQLILNLRQNPNHLDARWVDIVGSTEKRESLQDLLQISFDRAIKRLTKERGSNINQWKWGDVRPIRFRHVGRIPGFGASVRSSGGRHSISAIQEKHGPTWRMVVELGNNQRAWTSTAGPTSGEPMSKRFTRGLNDWAKGSYKEVKIMKTRHEGQHMKSWLLTPGGK